MIKKAVNLGSCATRRWALSSELTAKGAGEDGGHKGVEFGGGFGLEFFQRVYLDLEVVEIFHYALLLPQARIRSV